MTTPKSPLNDLATMLKSALNRLDAIASQNPPDWKLPLAYYKMGWTDRIGAICINSDGHGPTQVIWAGHIYTRRTGASAKYGVAIWFSRSNGQGDDGLEYARLITFKDAAPAEPLPDYVVDALTRSRPVQTVTPTR